MKSKVLRFLLAMLISLGIWMYVVMVVSPESETTIHGIPVMLDGESVLAERELIIVSEKDFTVDLKLFGNRVDLNKLTASNITVLADLSQITAPGQHNIRYSIFYPSMVESGNIDALEWDPLYITLTVAERGWKEIPVKVKFTGSVPEDYVADRQNPQFDHTTITISGPKEELEKVDHASIYVDLTGQQSTITGAYKPTLCAKDGTELTDVGMLTSNISEIRTTIKIQKIKQIPLVVELIDGGGLTAADVQVTPSMGSIVVSGSDAVLQKLEKIVVGQIDLADLMESANMEFDIIMPAGVSNVTGVTEMTVNVELLQQLEVRTFTVTQIRVENVPANRLIKLVTQAITVTIRGTKEALDALKPEDIVAVVDCSDVTDLVNMTTPLNVTIRIKTETTAGAVGNYQVVAEITEANSGGSGG